MMPAAHRTSKNKSEAKAGEVEEERSSVQEEAEVSPTTEAERGAEEQPSMTEISEPAKKLFNSAFFLEDAVLDRIALGISMLFLILVAIFFPGWIENWFEALSDFTQQR